VGDAESYAPLRAHVGRALPGSPEQMLFGGTEAAGGDLPGETVICSCNNVTADGIRCAIRDESLTDMGAVKDRTRAGTSCGSCVPLVKRLLDAELTAAGVEVSTALCEHFDHSRAELFEIVRTE